ncbi:MAG: thiamine pyrophosphate-binding protein [Promethearchaeia archaeon]
MANENNDFNEDIKTGSDIIVEYFIKEGIPYVIGVPGHGSLGFTDSLFRHRDEIEIIQPKQEQAGVHLAVGYYRVTGQPLPVFTSIGPGALNTCIGLADAFVDSMPVLVLTGDTHVHMRGVGVLQEIERKKNSDLPSALRPVVKRSFELARVEQVPTTIQRAFNVMKTGRPGPVHIDLPMDIQCAPLDKEVPEPNKHRTDSKMRGDMEYIKKAAKLLMSAKRPVIWLGGGVVASGAYNEVKKIAEFTGAAVLASMMAKDAFPNDHPLFGWATGSKGTKCGIELSSKADVVLALGTRFADESTCSYKKGEAWNFGPHEYDTRLIQVDIDPHEIGKNYPVDVGILGDVKLVLQDMLKYLNSGYESVDYKNTAYFQEIQERRKEWEEIVNEWCDPTIEPVIIGVVLRKLREFLDRNAIVITSSGNVQAEMIQELEFYEPNTCITAGGFSTMGYTLPATIGAKLGKPDTQVIGLVGDGDFMMTMAELHTAKQLDLNIVILIVNNAAWMAITDLQWGVFGDERSHGTEFHNRKGEVYSPNFAEIAKDFGCWGTRISKADEIIPALQEAFDEDGPAVIEVMVNRSKKYETSPAWGWWDVPVPAYLEKKRKKYEKERQDETI